MQGTNGIYFGFLPDDTTDGVVTIATINSESGKMQARKSSPLGILVSSSYENRHGDNFQITQLPYDGSQLLKVLEDVVESGAVFVPTVMPNNIPFPNITSEVAGRIFSVLQRFASQGVEVWLRFAHEMNWNADKGQVYAGGIEYRPLRSLRWYSLIQLATDELITAWQTVHAAMANNSKILIFWNPNYNTVDNLNPWWPGADCVDIVGMDNYLPLGTSFETAYSDFHYCFAELYNKHFAMRETDVINGSDVASKEEWLSQLFSADASAYPCYVSASWFEFLKTDFDYRLVLGQSEDTIEQTISHFK